MKCRHCGSKKTRVIVTEHHGNETWRYCKCLACEQSYKTIETYAIPKRGSAPGGKIHPNSTKVGEKNPASVLTEDNIKAIRDLARQHVTYKTIAVEFGLHESTIYRIVKRKMWSHV